LRASARQESPMTGSRRETPRRMGPEPPQPPLRGGRDAWIGAQRRTTAVPAARAPHRVRS